MELKEKFPEYKKIIQKFQENQNCQIYVNEIRNLILTKEIPDEEIEVGNTFRGLIWKSLIGGISIDVNYYENLLKKGLGENMSVLKDDVNRTMKGDKEIWSKISDEKLYRTINALLIDQGGYSSKFSYIQGMNVFLVPILYNLNEIESFYLIRKLFKNYLPCFFHFDQNLNAVKGPRASRLLLDQIIQLLDPDFYIFLSKNFPNFKDQNWANVYLLPFSVNQKPFKEVLKLWDFYFSYGFHFQILTMISQLLLNKNKIINTPKTINNILSNLILNSNKVIELNILLINKLPKDLLYILENYLINENLMNKILKI